MVCLYDIGCGSNTSALTTTTTTSAPVRWYNRDLFILKEEVGRGCILLNKKWPKNDFLPKN